jgi:hypothetical protein
MKFFTSLIIANLWIASVVVIGQSYNHTPINLPSSEILSSNIVQYFKAIPQKHKTLHIQQNGFTAPKGGHIQGVQQLGKRYLVVSGSSNDKAYFFIAKMNGQRLSKKGKIIKMVYINDDFPSMRHNHASGIQIMDNILIIGTEGGGDPIKSSLVFYDLSDPMNPKALKQKINRQQDTAGAIGICTYNNKIIIAAGGWDSDRVDIYKSNQSSFEHPDLEFSLLKTWQTKHKNISDWATGSWGTYQSLNFVKENDQDLFLVGFYQDAFKQSWAELYEVNLKNNPTDIFKKIKSRLMVGQEDTSFKNGGGLFFNDTQKRIRLFATARNWHPQIKISYW